MSIDQKNNCSVLENRAYDFRNTIEDHFIDEKGLLRCNINIKTMQPFTEKELEPFEITASGSTKAGRWTYEDTMFCSGLYLWSLVEEFKVTGNVEIKSKAQNFFEDLTKILKKSDKIESGYIGKPWGGEPSLETTLDQTFYLCMGLHAFCSISEGKDKKQASKIIVRNTDWWINRDYKNFQTPSDAIPVWLLPSHVGAMMAQVYLAYVHSHDDRFLDEVQKLIKSHQADLFLTRQSSQWLDADKDGLKVRRIALWHHAIAMALWLLNDIWPERSAYWKERLAGHWLEELKLGLKPDGTANQCVRVNLKDGKEVPFRLDEAGFFGEETAQIKRNHAQGWRWVSALESGCTSAHIGLSAALMADAIKWENSEAIDSLKTIMNKLTVSDMTRAHDPDGKQCYEPRRHWLDSLSSKGLATWLLTYWFSKRTGLI